MTPNKHLPHVHVLPEDEADSDIARGFFLNQNVIQGKWQILNYVGGWAKVIDEFEKIHIRELRNREHRRLVLVLDFDNRYPQRLSEIHDKIPPELQDRVFVLGVLSEPESLKTALGHKTCEDIGLALAQECAENKYTLWGHDLLEHNELELKRLISSVKPFLFAE